MIIFTHIKEAVLTLSQRQISCVLPFYSEKTLNIHVETNTLFYVLRSFYWITTILWISYTMALKYEIIV